MNKIEETPPQQSFGYLTVRAYTAGEALPVEGATVTVSDGGDRLINEEIVRLTGRSGQIEPLALPAPPIEDSQSPSATRPYAVYDLTVTHPNFYTFRASGVPVFSGITSLQPINMIPLTNYDTYKREPKDLTNSKSEQTLFDN